MTQTLTLGCFDRGSPRQSWPAFFSRYHEEAMAGQMKFRGEKDGEWVGPRVLPGNGVRELQALLRKLGFYPKGEIDGIFGYRTVSAARLFQEYVRSMEGRQDIGIPDGVVGSKTRANLDRWNKNGTRPVWSQPATANPAPAHQYWLEALKLYQQVNIAKPISRVVDMVNAYTSSMDTVKVPDWRFDHQDIHLIGIRRQEWRATQERANDDLFVLLVNGMAFLFCGSTDPNPSQVKRPDEPYLVRGQHRYRLGWHKVDNLSRVYRALRPPTSGVLVCRDFTRDDALTDHDLAGGLSVNPVINIHWSGSGTTNWSAGCQVIAGARYMNAANAVIDCGGFAATSYSSLPAKTRGAYNLLLDLITTFASSISVGSSTLVYYTLIYDRHLEREVRPGKTLAAAALEAVRGLSGQQRSELRQAVSLDALVSKLV